MGPPKRRRSPGRARWALCVASVTGALLAQRPARAEDQSCVATWPWSRLDRTALELARPVPLALTGTAAAVLPVFSPTGLDHWIRVRVQTDLGGRYRLERVSLAAPYAWGAGALVAWVAAKAGHASCAQQRVTASLLQGMITTLGVESTLKVALGRTWPYGEQDRDAPDRLSHPEYAKQYYPFQWRGLAWPSGHTAVSFAAAAALREVLPKKVWARWLGYPVAVGVGLGMIWGDYHWTSDVISGALLGEAIGGASGRAFREEGKRPRSGVEWTVVPMALPGEIRGIAVTGSF